MAREIIASRGESIKGEGKTATREERGAELFRSGAFERVTSGVFLVENTESRHVYRVDLERGVCSCPDFRRHEHLEGFACKHLHGVRLYARWLRRGARTVVMGLDEEVV